MIPFRGEHGLPSGRIPDGWRCRVQAILRGDRREQIIIRGRVRHDWQALFPGAFDYELLDALADALDDPDLPGRRIEGMEEPGETYEFIFTHWKRRVYSKINLTPGGEVVIVYSAHRPLRGDSL